jgi:uncharacterized protein
VTNCNPNELSFVEKNVVDNIKNTSVGVSAIHGIGLFADSEILSGTSLGVLDGQKILWHQYNALRNLTKQDLGIYSAYFFMEWNVLDSETLLVRPFRTKYSYINHSRTPNLQLTKVLPLTIVTLRDIKYGDELTLDYRFEPLPDHYLDSHGKTYL